MKAVFILGILLVLILGLTGCGGDKITGNVVADLTKNVIKNGETINLEVNGENTGNIPANVLLKIIPEDKTLIKITYPGSLEETLQPGEKIGKKIVTVQGQTTHSQTKLWIKTQLIDKETNKLLDEEIQWLTIQQ